MDSLPNSITGVQTHLRILRDPARFFLRDWPQFRDSVVDNPAQAAIDREVIDAWIDSLQEWGQEWGRERLSVESSEHLEAAHREWAVRRTDLFGAIEIGRNAIEYGIGSIREPVPTGGWIQVYGGVVSEFAERWAVTPGDEVAAVVFRSRFGFTNISAFALAEQNREFTEWIQLNGNMAYHIVGDPRNADMHTFMKHADEWARAMSGTPIRMPGGQPAAIYDLASLQESVSAFKRKFNRSPTQLDIAEKFGVTERTINRACKRFEVTWRDLLR